MACSFYKIYHQLYEKAILYRKKMFMVLYQFRILQTAENQKLFEVHSLYKKNMCTEFIYSYIVCFKRQKNMIQIPNVSL